MARSVFLYANSSGNIQESATSAKQFNVSASLDLNRNINLSAFMGYVQAFAESGPSFGDRAYFWSRGANFGLPGLVKEDDLLVLGFDYLS